MTCIEQSMIQRRCKEKPQSTQGIRKEHWACLCDLSAYFVFSAVCCFLFGWSTRSFW